MVIFLYIKIGLVTSHNNFLFHYIITMNEKRYFNKKKFINDFLIFDWKTYVNNYQDITYINTKEEAWYHWLNHGKNENRVW